MIILETTQEKIDELDRSKMRGDFMAWKLLGMMMEMGLINSYELLYERADPNGRWPDTKERIRYTVDTDYKGLPGSVITLEIEARDVNNAVMPIDGHHNEDVIIARLGI